MNSYCLTVLRNLRLSIILLILFLIAIGERFNEVLEKATEVIIPTNSNHTRLWLNNSAKASSISGVTRTTFKAFFN